MSDKTLYLGFSRSAGGLESKIVGDLIRDFTGGEVNHAFLAWYSENMRGWLTRGANAGGITDLPLDKFVASRVIVDLWAPIEGDLWVGMRALHDLIGKPYDYLGLLGMAGVEIERHLGIADPTNWLADPHRRFCSQYAAQIVVKSNLPGSRAAEMVAQINAANPNTIDPTMLRGLGMRSGEMIRFAPNEVFKS